MATPWDRINDETYKRWLEDRQITMEEFNGASLLDRSSLRLQFEQQQQQLLLRDQIPDDISVLASFVRETKIETQTLVMSETKTRQFDSAMQKFDFRKDAAKWVEKPSDLGPAGPKHIWLASKEDSAENRAAYMAYLKCSENIVLPQGTQLFEGNTDKELLTVRFMEFEDIKTSGKIDVVLASSHHQSVFTLKQNILVGIELKKDTNREHSKIERQVVLQHIAASYLNPTTGILTVMTDLDARWHFFWFAHDKRLLRYEATKSEARFLISHSLDKQESHERRGLSTPTSFLNRACWNEMFSTTVNTIGKHGSFHGDGRDFGSSSQNHEEDDNSPDASGQTSSQQGSSSTLERRLHAGPEGSSSNAGQQAPMGDATLEFMDEEERVEETLRRELQTFFHKMLYLPEEEGRTVADVFPSNIMMG